MSLRDKFKSWMTPPPDPQPGITHWRGGGELQGVRLHLRIEADGKGVLIINAAKILHLNETAAEMAQMILRDIDPEQAAKTLKRRYKAPLKQLRDDYADLREKILLLAQNDEVCPVTYLGLERVEPFTTRGSVPHRMDLALTYQCNNKCGHCYVDRPSDMPSLSRADWLRVIHKTWDLGIPQLIFTGGEATLHEDLPLLIAEAEELGQVTGLISNGRKLAAPAFLEKLIGAGLDHVQITLESHLENVHDKMVGVPGAFTETCAGIRHAAAAGIYLLTNTTLSKQNAMEIDRFLDFLVELGVANMAMNGFIHAGKGRAHPDAIREKDLPEILERVRDGAAERDLTFRWYTPTQYCTCNPVDLGLGIKQCTAGRYNMCIEPNGSVIPCQSYFESLGHFLDDDWATIWQDPRLVELREHTWVDEKCATCHDLEVCGGGCPLYRRMIAGQGNPGAHGC